jgi:hypothetical protein
MPAYEVLLFRPDGVLSVVCLASFASDRHAISSARLLLDERLPAARLRQDERPVADLCLTAAISLAA